MRVLRKIQNAPIFWGKPPALKIYGNKRMASHSQVSNISFELSAAETAELRETFDAQITLNSRRQYRSSASHFLFWLYRRSPDLIRGEFIFELDPVSQSGIFQRLSNPDRANPPIFFSNLSAKTFLTWIIGLKKKQSDEPPSFSTLNGHRSGLRNLFNEYGAKMSDEFGSELDSHFCGKRKKMAKDAADRGGKAYSGKAPFSHELYVSLCDAFLKGPAEFQMAGLFFRLTWNLMCRANNASNIAYQHIEWHNDALRIFFIHSKTDQDGTKVRHPRHCYANPQDYRQCLITSLGIYWLLFPPDPSQPCLFPGSRQYDRYRSILSKVLMQEEVKDALAAKGLEPGEIGSHSGRKSSASFITSGTTAAPSLVSIKLRGGWGQEGQGDVYFHPDPASDQYIGRLVSGLPIYKPEFAILPPFFTRLTPDVNAAIDLCFPGLPARLRETAEFCLASLVWHSAALQRDLPSVHPLRFTSLFRNADLLRRLSVLVESRLGRPTDRITATGIPPHVVTLQEIQTLQAQLANVLPALQTLSAETVRGVITELEKRAISANTVTYDGLQETIAMVLRNTGLTQLLETLQSGSLLQSSIPDASTSASTLRVYTWGGKLHRVPEDFKFPTNATVLQILQLWFFGSDIDPPYRFLCSQDLPPSKSNANRLSDLRFLHKKFVEFASRASRQIPETMTPVELNDFFTTIILPSIEGKRRSQKQWRTYVAQLRNESKRARIL